MVRGSLNSGIEDKISSGKKQAKICTESSSKKILDGK